MRARRIFVPLRRNTSDPRWLTALCGFGVGLGATVAAVLIAAMILKVQAPGLIEDLPRWITRSLDTDAWWTVLALVVAFFLAVGLYWRMQQFTETPLGVLVASCLVLLTIVLALPTYASCAERQADFWAPLTWTLSLFLGNEPAAGGTCATGPPLALQVARFSGIMTTFISLIAVVLSVLSAQRDRLHAHFATSVVLVVGLDHLTKRFIDVLTRQTAKGSTVILLEPDRTNQLVPEIRRRGVRVLFSDPKDRRVIEKLLVRGQRNLLNTAFVLTPVTSDALVVANNVLATASAQRPDGAYPRLVTRVDEPAQAEAWRRGRITDDLDLLTDTVGVYRVIAQEVVDDALEAQPEKLVIAGAGVMALSILGELVQHRREQAVYKAPPPLEVVLVAEDADELIEDQLLSHRWYGEDVDADVISTLLAEPTVDSLATALAGSTAACVVLAMPPSPEQEQLGNRLALRHPEHRVLTWSDDVQRIAQNGILANLRTFGITLVATHKRAGDVIEVLPEDGWERIARRLHEHYVETRTAPGERRKASLRDWDDLSRFYRESNLRRVAVALQIGVRAGRTWLPPARGSRVPRRLTEDEVRALAPVEHASWCRFYQANGFRRGPRRERPGRVLRHPALVPWNELPEVDREYTVQSLMQCFRHLEAMGYIPFDTSMAAPTRPYRRTGVVVAQQLDETWSWTSDGGASMTAQAGDWKVSDGDGKVWSITDADFRRSYEPVEGDTYRRTGRVRARPTIAGEQVVSTEGVEAAVDGDWLVEDDAGKRWIVPDDRFRRTYVADD